MCYRILFLLLMGFIRVLSCPQFFLLSIWTSFCYKLKHNAVGCYWDHHFAGAFCYADDLILLAPSPSALRIMLHTCESFSASHGLKFNATKTQLIRFGSSPSSNCQTTVFLWLSSSLC